MNIEQLIEMKTAYNKACKEYGILADRYIKVENPQVFDTIIKDLGIEDRVVSKKDGSQSSVTHTYADYNGITFICSRNSKEIVFNTVNKIATNIATTAIKRNIDNFFGNNDKEKVDDTDTQND